MKVVIMGGGGYIGNALIRTYLDAGYFVRCVDNFHKGQCDALLSLVNNPKFEFKYGDVTKIEDCMENIKGMDYVVNLAGIVGFPACKRQPKLSYLVNVEGAKNVVLARNAINTDIPLFFASTGSIYGKIEEDCTEQTTPNPQSIYGAHKLEAEKFVSIQRNTLCYRFATAFGVSPCMRVNLLINDLVYHAVTQKHITVFEADAKRTFIHISDFCNAIKWGLENIDKLHHSVYNCGDASLNYSKREIAELIKGYTGCTVIYNDFNSDDDARNYVVNYERLNKAGFKCEKSIAYGIEELLKAIPLLRIHHQYE